VSDITLHSIRSGMLS